MSNKDEDYIAVYDDDDTNSNIESNKKSNDTSLSSSLNNSEENNTKGDIEVPDEFKDSLKSKSTSDEIDNKEVDIVDPVEEAARQQGWLPKEEWDGDPTQWRDAATFLERGEYFKIMGSQRKEIDRLNNTVRELADTFNKVRQDEREKVLKEYRLEKADAMEKGDYSRVVEIDADIDKIKEESQQASMKSNEDPNAAQPSQDVDPMAEQKFDHWRQANQWYLTDKKKTYFADRVGVEYKNNHPEATMDEVLNEVTRAVNAEFGSPSTSGNSNSRSPVGSSGITTQPASKRGNKRKTMGDLSDQQREVVRRFEKLGVDPNQYIKELQAIGELDDE